MPIVGWRTAGRLALTASLLLIAGEAHVAAQGINIGGIIGGVGGIMQGAMQAEQQRQQLEQIEHIEQLRLQQLRYQNGQRQSLPANEYPSSGNAQAVPVQEPVQQASAIPNPALYRVEKTALGDIVDQRMLDRDYKCHASDQFEGFTWCQQNKVIKGVATSTAILTSPQNGIVYDTKFYGAARFQPGSVEGQIQRLSENHQEQARRLTMAREPDGGGAVIATWGALTLVPVDSAAIADLAAGNPVTLGVLVDFLANARESARRGLPVYRIQGGAGYYWAARWDGKGAGTLRFGICNAALFDFPGRTIVRPAPPQAVAVQQPTPIPAAPTNDTNHQAATNLVDAAVKAADNAGTLAVIQPKQAPPVAAPPAPVPAPAPSPAAAIAQATVPDQGKRVALVIGNSSYRTVARLDNPSRDAEAIAQTLRSVGFSSVKLIEDATLDEMRAALRDFQEQADDADWAMVYYAGHGIEISGQNYLIPVDARLKTDQNADDEALTLRYVLDKMHNARKLHLVILDACRENPFQSAMKRQIASRAVQRGLAPYEPRVANEMVVYAAKDGEQAQDGDNSGHSPFAKALLSRLTMPHVEINKVFRLVTADVLAATGNRQQPFVYGSTPGEEDFIFLQ